MTTNMPPIIPAPVSHPAIVALFDDLYRVRIPQGRILSIQAQRQLGTYGSGDKKVDQMLSRQQMFTWLSIDHMVEHFKQGTVVGIVDPEDTKKIYDVIASHLQAWVASLKRSVNIARAPFEDLMAMDQFAAAVYKHARFHFNEELVRDAAGKKLLEVTGFNPMTFFANRPMLVSHVKTKHEKQLDQQPVYNPSESEHGSLLDILKRSAMQIRN